MHEVFQENCASIRRSLALLPVALVTHCRHCQSRHDTMFRSKIKTYGRLTSGLPTHDLSSRLPNRVLVRSRIQNRLPRSVPSVELRKISRFVSVFAFSSICSRSVKCTNGWRRIEVKEKLSRCLISTERDDLLPIQDFSEKRRVKLHTIRDREVPGRI
jgi:hypothetical protein